MRYGCGTGTVAAEEFRGERIDRRVAVRQDCQVDNLPAENTSPDTTSLARFELRLIATPTIRNGLGLDHRTLIQPVADDFGDYLFSSHTSLRVLLVGVLAFQSSYAYTYDSTPAPGVQFRSDRTLSTGLLFEFN